MKQNEIKLVEIGYGVAKLRERSRTEKGKRPSLEIMLPSTQDDEHLFPMQELQLYYKSVEQLYNLLHEYYTSE